MMRDDHIKNLIYNYNRRLQLLKEQQALRGLNTPPEILLEIEDIEAKLGQLETELKEIANSPEPIPPVNELAYLHEQLALFEAT